MTKAALISVSDRTGLAEFAKVLQECGFKLLATSGSAKFLSAAGISTVAIEEYTGQREILGGRVKTLHPKIHGGLLAKRSDSEHMAQLEQDSIWPIDVAVVNLYPFLDALQSEAAKEPAKMVELIDIGGPTMIRAAAKNFSSVWPVIDPADYAEVGEFLRRGDSASEAALALRRKLAVKVFAALARYNLEIARYFSCTEAGGTEWAPEQTTAGMVLNKAQDLRYGENPHQKAAFYERLGARDRGWRQLQGKELSYNNLLDFDAACRIIRALPGDAPAVAIIKHMNPCGAACAATLTEALVRAKAGDPRSHFGGIIACNRQVDAAAAAGIIDDFTEIVVAPSFTDEALDFFGKRKNLRVLQVDLEKADRLEVRSVQGGILMQETDGRVEDVRSMRSAAGREPSAREFADLEFAWALCAHVKSNAIVLVKDRMLLASGAGQMSRVDAVETALMKTRIHKHDTNGAVAASDAFFPFTDSVGVLADAGVTAIVVPSGAKRDEEVVAAAQERRVSLLFASERHFRH